MNTPSRLVSFHPIGRKGEAKPDETLLDVARRSGAPVGNSWQALEGSMPAVPFLWLDFEFGGHGVCALTAGQLKGMTDSV